MNRALLVVTHDGPVRVEAVQTRATKHDVKLTPVHLLEFGLGLRTAIAIDGQAVVALEFFDGGFEGAGVGTVEFAGGIAEVIETGDLAGDFVDRIKMADFDGDDFVSEGSLIAADGENAFFGVERDFLLNLATAVGGELVGLAVDE